MPPKKTETDVPGLAQFQLRNLGQISRAQLFARNKTYDY